MWDGTDMAASGAQEIDALRMELGAKERELQELREQLRSIHNSEAWAVLRTFSQLRFALAPRGTRRDELARLGIKGLRRLKKGVMHLSTETRNTFRRRARVGNPGVAPEANHDNLYALICLPSIEWGYRFQRPQQIMRRFAQHGHRVLFAANHFHRGVEARLRDIESNVQEVVLPGDPSANVYQSLPAAEDLRRMVAAFEMLQGQRRVDQAVVVAQLPYWTALAEVLRARYGWPVVYDCMDELAGFLHNTPAVLDAEVRLIATSDLVIASSERLLHAVRGRARRALLVRNGCDFEHFGEAASRPACRRAAPVVGYFGAISDWFDSALVAELACARPDLKFELIGSTLGGEVRCLEELPNVRLLGERPYGELPRLIAGWDVYIIPFKRIPLTEATNPVKIYEMLATGKPVVATDLPELVPIAELGLISLGSSVGDYLRAIAVYLATDDPELILRRRAFARQNTWHARYLALSEAIVETLAAPAPQPEFRACDLPALA
jgi:glycosyltransferase involved in cell wall biosynthesis